MLAAIFVCNVPQATCGWFASHTWTLAFEEQFYLAFPIIFYFSGQRIGRVFLTILALTMLCPWLRFALHLQGAWRDASVVFSGFSFICMGAVAAAYEARLKRWFLAPGSIYVTWLAATFVLASSTLAVFVAFRLQSPAAYIQAGLGDVLTPPCLAWLVLYFVYQDGPVTILLRNPVLQFLGFISYSLYLWQQAFTAHISHYLVDSWLMFPPLMLVAAILSYYCIERPCIRIGRRLLSRDPLIRALLVSSAD
jgi:peptidoglycan/LPS O-acetylase OafA/YrhL